MIFILMNSSRVNLFVCIVQQLSQSWEWTKSATHAMILNSARVQHTTTVLIQIHPYSTVQYCRIAPNRRARDHAAAS